MKHGVGLAGSSIQNNSQENNTVESEWIPPKGLNIIGSNWVNPENYSPLYQDEDEDIDVDKIIDDYFLNSHESNFKNFKNFEQDLNHLEDLRIKKILGSTDSDEDVDSESIEKILTESMNFDSDSIDDSNIDVRFKKILI